MTRVKNKRYNTEHTLQVPPFDGKAKRELSTSAPDLAADADAEAAVSSDASPLAGNRFSVAAQSSALDLFDDMVEEPAADVDMHIPQDNNIKEKGGMKAVVEEEDQDSSSSSEEEGADQSHSPAPCT